MRRLILVLLFVTVVAMSSATPSAALAQKAEEAAPVVAVEGQRIEGQYIVVFNETILEAAPLASRLVQERGGTLLSSYEHALKGFAARLGPEAVEALRKNPHVAYIEPDQVMTVADTQTQTPATWGIDRIDQRTLPLSNSYSYNTTGSGVHAYIIDSGIHLSHGEFGGRAVSGFDAVDGGSADDCNGHGTHVAGTVGGATYGVAKDVKLYAVRVLDCRGSSPTSVVLAGVDWVTANHVKPAVANMSLGGGRSSALDEAVGNSIAAGVTYAVAAGNSSRNACFFSPARVGAAITVGSTDASDARSSFSNWGRCLDIFAPGSEITSAWDTGNSAVKTISGTSMASPHVAGVAALYLERNGSASPAEVRDAIVSGATPGIVSDVPWRTPNLFLYSAIAN